MECLRAANCWIAGFSAFTAYALPAGDEGQEITVYLKTKGSNSNAVVAGAFVGGTALTLDTAGKMAKLKFLKA
jgi:hypothetical protein